MAIIALHLWRDASRDLLIACLTHDLGESVTGDIPWSAKNASPYLKQELYAMEVEALDKMGMCFPLEKPGDNRRLKYLDRLDAYLWAMHHKPKLRKRKEWREAREWLREEKRAMDE
jgi:5'-deoxynucleotidase YfbR-like HD superfamily hydrolase